MEDIVRGDVNDEYAYSGYVAAGDFVFLTFCEGNTGQPVEEQVHGVLNDMEQRLAGFGSDLSAVVKVDVLLRDAWNIPIMEKVFKERFKGKYPARKTIESNFAHAGGPGRLEVQIDGIAYKGRTGK